AIQPEREIITFRGRLKQNVTTKETGSEVGSILIFFWKDSFRRDSFGNTAGVAVDQLKEGQIITVKGYYSGRDNGLFHVTELVEVETEDE
ncbi:26571_t:CDS:2, partial [Racocetra persica]